MDQRGAFTRILAVVGAILVWFPILAPVLLTSALLVVRRMFRFDFLMPAELFLFALIGGGLLIWAALRAHLRWRLIGWGLGLATALLVLGQALAVMTGLASGEMEPHGIWWALVLVSLVAYIFGLLAAGVGAVRLLSELFQRPNLPTGST